MKPIKYKSTKKLHLTDKELADFIDNKLSIQKREQTLEHLIYCKECICIVAKVIKNTKKK